MQIAADPVRQAAQSRCSLWWVSQNTCWRWVSEQRASSHSSMWFYFSLVWAQWWVFWSIREPQTERGRGWKMSVKTRLAGMRMLGAHGLGCHQDPQPCGYSPVWRIGLHLCGFDGFPEIVTGLFSIVKVPGFKGRCPRWQGCSNIAVNPQFLVGVDADCFCRNHVLYALPDETRYRIWVLLYVVIRRCLEHVPVHVIKTVL